MTGSSETRIIFSDMTKAGEPATQNALWAEVALECNKSMPPPTLNRPDRTVITKYLPDLKLCGLDTNTEIHPEGNKSDLQKSKESLSALYSKAIPDKARLGRFLGRLGELEKSDPALLKELGAIGKDISDGAKPEVIGNKLAIAMIEHFNRTVGNRAIDFVALSKDENLMGGLSGMMLCARTSVENTKKMVKSFNDTVTHLDDKRFHSVSSPDANTSLYAIFDQKLGEPRLVVVINQYRPKSAKP